MLHNQLNDMQKSCDETAGIIQDLQKRIARLREPGLLFSSIVVQIYITSLHLNKVTSDEFHYTLLPAAQGEYNLNINDRKVTMDIVTFIQECVFRHFGIPEASRGEVWSLCKKSLNQRVRQYRKQTVTPKLPCPYQDADFPR
uniref:BEN domain-containing protein n=1 Tax=Heterorhabditis bacteriophora TaxID=37862 RepID=A0A1I7XCU7_HETBA